MDLQQALDTVDVEVNESTTRKRLNQFNFDGRKPLVWKRNMKVRLKLSRENVDKDHTAKIVYLTKI